MGGWVRGGVDIVSYVKRRLSLRDEIAQIFLNVLRATASLKESVWVTLNIIPKRQRGAPRRGQKKGLYGGLHFTLALLLLSA